MRWLLLDRYHFYFLMILKGTLTFCRYQIRFYSKGVCDASYVSISQTPSMCSEGHIYMISGSENSLESIESSTDSSIFQYISESSLIDDTSNGCRSETADHNHHLESVSPQHCFQTSLHKRVYNGNKVCAMYQILMSSESATHQLLPNTYMDIVYILLLLYYILHIFIFPQKKCLRTFLTRNEMKINEIKCSGTNFCQHSVDMHA